jgi:hypothetical protein
MTIYTTLAKSHPSIERGKVWCKTCKRMQRVDPAQCLQSGWPKCCGYTMTIDSPQKRTALARAAQRR